MRAVYGAPPPPPPHRKQYLGDGVYVSDDGYHVILTTSDGISETNTIFLDDDVLAALTKFLESRRK